MKKILMALAALTIICFHATAQKMQKKPATHGTAATIPAKKNHRWHAAPKAPQDFQICRDNRGYHICNEAPGPTNSTHSWMVIKDNDDDKPVYEHSAPYQGVVAREKGNSTAPVSQSFPDNTNYDSGVGDFPYTNPHRIVLGPQ